MDKYNKIVNSSNKYQRYFYIFYGLNSDIIDDGLISDAY
jgi:hypothetical protein